MDIARSPQHLNTTITDEQSTANTATATLTNAMQQLLARAAASLNLNLGDSTMVWLAEPPSFIDQPVTTLLVAQAAPQIEAANQKKRVMGVCTIVNGAGESAYEVKTEISSGFYAREYMYDYEGRDLLFVTNPQTTIIQQPQHGRLAEGWYYPDKGYFGDDTIIAKVEENGVVVEVRFFIHVLEYNEADPYYYCGEEVRREFLRQGQGNSWKISAAPNATSTDLAYTLSLPAAFLGADYTSPAVTFANLTGAAVGETKGEGANVTITLDTNAAGHGWYIDYTPYLNEEFLPTSNPNEWVAKAGSPAAGKMDMLSVLLHEYGHALGLEHSVDAHDFMGTTLTPQA